MSIPVATPGKTRIGWIGTGVMGRWMCQHAMSKGYSATVYNRSPEKAQPLELARRSRRAPRNSPRNRT
ncbi:MAG: NAD(P)-binding domain-containing protein [Gemmataceae bacterium]